MATNLHVKLPTSLIDGVNESAHFAGVSSLNLLVGVNGAGKSTLLRKLDSAFKKLKQNNYSEADTFANNVFGLRLDKETLGAALQRFQEKYPDTKENTTEKIAKRLVSPDDLKAALHFLSNRALTFTDEILFGNEIQSVIRESIPEDKRNLIGSGWWSIFLEIIQELLDLDKPSYNQSVLIPEHRTCPIVEHAERDNFFSNAKGEKPFNLTEYLFSLKSSSQGSERWKRYQKLKIAFKTVTQGANFEVILTGNIMEVEFNFRSSPWIKLANTGKGFEDVLVMLFWLTEPRMKVVLIEEIESHLHPRLLINLASYISTSIENKICFVSTHSSDLLRSPIDKSVYWIECSTNSANKPLISINNETSETAILKELGVQPLDYFGASILVMIEGPSDEVAIKQFMHQLGFSPLQDLCFFYLSGDNMVHVEPSQWKDKFKVIALIDADPGSDKARNKFKEKCNASSVKFFQLERYAVENYFSSNAYKTVFPSLSSSIPDVIPPLQRVEDVIGVSPKRNIEKLAKLTSVNDLKGTRLHGFLIALADLVTETSKFHSENQEETLQAITSEAAQ